MNPPAGKTLTVAALAALLSVGGLPAQESKTVIGTSNTALQEGAEALLAHEGEKGVRLSLLGLQRATSARERQAANSNLCAGYILLEQYEAALSYCDAAIAENHSSWRAYSNRALVNIRLQRFPQAEQDLLKGEALNPTAGALQRVRQMYRDAVLPVSPSIIIDDRRLPATDPGEGAAVDEG